MNNKKSSIYFISISILLLVAINSQCTVTKMDTPSGFVMTDAGMDNGGYEYHLRYISQNNSRMTVKRIDWGGDGKVEFWFPYIEKALMEDLGYVRLSEPKDVKSKNDLPGKVCTYTKTIGEDVYNYLLAVFVKERKQTKKKQNYIYILEYAGEEAIAKDELVQVEKSIPTLALGKSE